LTKAGTGQERPQEKVLADMMLDTSAVAGLPFKENVPFLFSCDAIGRLGKATLHNMLVSAECSNCEPQGCLSPALLFGSKLYFKI
jgi:hypothetical protein